MKSIVGDTCVLGRERATRWLASLSALSFTGLSLVSFGVLGVPLSASGVESAGAVPGASTTASPSALVSVGVKKLIVGTPSDPAPETYVATLTCTAPGGDPGVPVALTLLVDGTAVSTPGIVVGSSCTVDEPNPPIGAAVSYTPGATFVVGSQDADVTITNTFGPATVTVGVHKAVVGAPSDPASSTYAATLTCTAPAGDPGVPVLLTLPADGTVVSTSGIVNGSSCAIDETTTPVGATVTYSPGALFTAGPNGADVTITNTFAPATATVSVHKTVVGVPSDPVPASYDVTLTCTPPIGVPGEPVVLTLLADGTVVPTSAIVVGSSCTIDETTPPAGATVSYDPGPTFVVGSQGADVTITNTFPPATATIAVHKTVVGVPSDPIPATYAATLTCVPPNGVPGAPVVVTLLADGTVVPTPGIVVGSSCTIEETTPPAGAMVTYTPGATFVVGSQGADVTITNTFPPAIVSVGVHKAVVGTPSDPVPASYGAALTCSAPGGDPGVPVSLTLPADGTVVSTSGIVVGSSCTVDEPNPPTGATVTYTPGATFVVGSQGADVTVTNTFVPATVGVNVHKEIVGTPSAPAPATYDATLTCAPPGGVPGEAVALALSVDGTVVSTPGIVVGSSCTVNEATPPADATVTYTPGATFVVGSQGVDVTVTNTFPTVSPTTPVTLQMVVEGFPPAPAPTGYVVTVTCAPGVGGPAITYPVTLSADGTPVVQQVINGSTCAVIEPTPPPEVTVSYNPATFSAAGTPVEVTVTNYFAPRLLFVNNVVEGTPPSPAPTSYLLSITCTAPGGGPVTSETMSLPPNTGALTTGFYSLGSSCSLQELNPPVGAMVSYSPGQTFTFTPETSVRVYNRFAAPVAAAAGVQQ